VVRQHSALALAASTLLFLVIAVGGIAARATSPTAKQRGRRGRPRAVRAAGALLLATIGTSVLSTSATGILLFAVLTRPAWCPDRLCLPSEDVGASHDADLAAALVAEQASTFLIPEDPSSYSIGHLPPTSGAAAVVAQQTVRELGQDNLFPYRLELSLRNLDSGSGPGILIEGLSVRLVTVSPPPSPTRVWLQAAGTWDLHVKPYEVIYDGQRSGESIDATSRGDLFGHIHLNPAERDYVTLTVTSTTPAALHFQVKIVYRVLSQQTFRMLTLNEQFTAVFADAGRWAPYQLVDGRLVPQ
jgi:hypothetical protein